MKATSGNLGGAGLHVTTTLTKLEEPPSPTPPSHPGPSVLQPLEHDVEEEETTQVLYIVCFGEFIENILL